MLAAGNFYPNLLERIKRTHAKSKEDKESENDKKKEKKITPG